jgi:sugar O-acyltransferase (sialic acid O-acetyltransferase NeuD family)
MSLEARRIAVLGAGGHAKVVISTLQAAGIAPGVALDDDPSRWGGAVLGVEMRGPIDEFHGLGYRCAVVAIGDNRERRRLVAELAAGGEIEWETVVHPSAVVHSSVRLGPGTVVFAGAVIQPDATVGAHAIINTGASVDHDCQLGDFVHLAPGGRLGGAVTVGEGALLGIGCAVLPGRSVGAWAVVGAGATVTEDVGEGWTVAGTPARRLDPED